MMWFLETAIRGDGRAFGLPVDATDVSACERVPGVGMQVGSLISQMTANVVLTPHIASATVPTRMAMANLAADNLIGYLVHGKALTPLNTP